jgi:hypothetical protein
MSTLLAPQQTRRTPQALTSLVISIRRVEDVLRRRGSCVWLKRNLIGKPLGREASALKPSLAVGVGLTTASCFAGGAAAATQGPHGTSNGNAAIGNVGGILFLLVVGAGIIWAYFSRSRESSEKCRACGCLLALEGAARRVASSPTRDSNVTPVMSVAACRRVATDSVSWRARPCPSARTGIAPLARGGRCPARSCRSRGSCPLGRGFAPSPPPLVADDLARTIDGGLLGVGVGAGPVAGRLLHVPTVPWGWPPRGGDRCP